MGIMLLGMSQKQKNIIAARNNVVGQLKLTCPIVVVLLSQQ
jgi:hypothetical protein